MSLTLRRALSRTAIWLLLALAGMLLLWWQQPEDDNPADEAFSLNTLLGSDSAESGFESARHPARLSFPRDHGPHPAFQNEWWYLTGQLQDTADPERRFGFQFTLFRFALAAEAETDDGNPWLVPQMYMAHFAVTSVEAGEHRAAERFSRQGPGLAGAAYPEAGEGSQVPSGLKLWLGDWSLQSGDAGELFPARLQAADTGKGMAVQLQTRALKPRVLQGDAGFSLKNRDGGASYYYSYPRLALDGVLQWQQQSYQVSGQGWFDHEWSSNSLAPWQAGWDWFSLQLDDGRELMFYRFRNRDGSEGLSHLALIDRDGNIRAVDREAVDLQVQDWWQSAAGVRYPSRWKLTLAEEGLALDIEPLVSDQLMALSVEYWEGAVGISGSHRGRGYVELAGYR